MHWREALGERVLLGVAEVVGPEVGLRRGRALLHRELAEVLAAHRHLSVTRPRNLRWDRLEGNMLMTYMVLARFFFQVCRNACFLPVFLPVFFDVSNLEF